MDRETAVEFVRRIEAAFALLGELNADLSFRLESADLGAARDKLGRIILELDLGVLEVIYRAQPGLRPQGMIPVKPLGAGTHATD